MKFYTETNRIPVRKEVDVAVVGAGIAGIAAALAAARNGAKTLLIEKGVVPGGLATAGLVVHYLPLCDGNGNKVTGGIAEELLRLSIKYGFNTLPEEWKSGAVHVPTKQRYKTLFNPAAFVLALDEALEEAGISILYDTGFGNVAMEDGFCTGIIVENSTGRFGIPVKAVVDATGDADVFFKAGAPLVSGSSELSFWALALDSASIRKACEENDVSKALLTNKSGYIVDHEQEFDEKTCPVYPIRNPEDMTRFILDGRALLRKDLDRMKTGEKVFACLPSMPQHRTTRRIDGAATMKIEDDRKHMMQPVGCVSDWRKAGPVWEIPFQALTVNGFRNLFAAGRCVSAESEAWEIMRCIPQSASTGQAAGTAAALCVKQKTGINGIRYETLARNLTDAGVKLTID